MPLYKLTYNGTELSYDNGFVVSNIPAGLGAVDNISTVPTTADGSSFVSSFSPEKQIIITLKAFNHADRQRIYSLFAEKTEPQNLVYEPIDGSFAAREIKCRVTKVSPLQSKFPTNVQVVLLAEQPFWRSQEQFSTGITGEIDADFKFELSLPENDVFVFSRELEGNSQYVNYDGTIPTGANFIVNFSAPKSWVKIVNQTTIEQMTIEYDFAADSQLIISTSAGTKNAKYFAKGAVDGVDITDGLVWGSKFMQLVQGKNRIFADASDGIFGVALEVVYNAAFGGV